MRDTCCAHLMRRLYSRSPSVPPANINWRTFCVSYPPPQKNLYQEPGPRECCRRHGRYRELRFRRGSYHELRFRRGSYCKHRQKTHPSCRELFPFHFAASPLSCLVAGSTKAGRTPPSNFDSLPSRSRHHLPGTTMNAPPPQIPLLQQQLVVTLQLLVLFSATMETDDLLTIRARLSDTTLFIVQTIIERENAANCKPSIPSCLCILIVNLSLTTLTHSPISRDF